MSQGRNAITHTLKNHTHEIVHELIVSVRGIQPTQQSVRVSMCVSVQNHITVQQKCRLICRLGMGLGVERGGVDS